MKEPSPLALPPPRGKALETVRDCLLIARLCFAYLVHAAPVLGFFIVHGL